MKIGNSLRRWKFLTAGLTVMTLAMSGSTARLSASSLLSVTDEAQIQSDQGWFSKVSDEK